MESGLPILKPATSCATKKEAESFLFPDCFSPGCSAKIRIIAPFLRLVKKFSGSGRVPERPTVPSPSAATSRCRRHADLPWRRWSLPRWPGAGDTLALGPEVCIDPCRCTHSTAYPPNHMKNIQIIDGAVNYRVLDHSPTCARSAAPEH